MGQPMPGEMSILADNAPEDRLKDGAQKMDSQCLAFSCQVDVTKLLMSL